MACPPVAGGYHARQAARQAHAGCPAAAAFYTSRVGADAEIGERNRDDAVVGGAGGN